jgi:hypothetical protein
MPPQARVAVVPMRAKATAKAKAFMAGSLFYGVVCFLVDCGLYGFLNNERCAKVFFAAYQRIIVLKRAILSMFASVIINDREVGVGWEKSEKSRPKGQLWSLSRRRFESFRIRIWLISEDALAFVEEEVVVLVEGGGGNRVVDRQRGGVDGGHAAAGDGGGGADEGEGDGENEGAGEGFHGCFLFFSLCFISLRVQRSA